MRLALGALVMLVVGIPRILVAQANSPSIPVCQLQASSAREETPTRLGLRYVDTSLEYASFRSEQGLYRLFGTDGEGKAAAVPSGGSPASTTAEPVSAFRSTSDPKKLSRRLWYALLIAQHSAAAFDAWSTRDVVHGGRADELNPLLRPFAHSNALYAATQLGPGLLDYLGHRMLHSKKHWAQRFWWVPQSASTVGSVWSGAHNLAVN